VCPPKLPGDVEPPSNVPATLLLRFRRRLPEARAERAVKTLHPVIVTVAVIVAVAAPVAVAVHVHVNATVGVIARGAGID
jgi:hypothetical protein